jgi:hypothetical protein
MWLSTSKGSGIAFCDPISEEVSAAQQWLMSGQGDIPNARWLACSVDGYKRRGDVATFSEWVRIKLPFITPDLIESLSIQELLDLLFYFHRTERFSEGTLLEMATEIETIVTSIAHRVINPRRKAFSLALYRIWILGSDLNRRPFSALARREKRGGDRRMGVSY